MYYPPYKDMKHSAAGLLLILLAVCALSTPAAAQVPADRNALLNGETAGQATTAEINGYPGTAFVLEHTKELQLSSGQIQAVLKVKEETLSRAKELGKRIVQIEQELDEAFKSGMLNERSIQDDSEQIGKLRGRLRAVHLAANYRTKSLLTQVQLEKYRALRNAQKQTGK